jgi:hypothetical protein
VQSKSEEVARALFWCFLPLLIAWWWASHLGQLAACGGEREIETVFSSLYSESFFSAHRAEFFHAVAAFFWMNWCLLWRLYAIVVLVSAGFLGMIQWYGPIRQRLSGHEHLRSLLAILVLPRVSDWHVLLSRMLLPSKDPQMFVDVLTKSDQLYQGQLSDKTLGPDGTLINITLAKPSKFRRDRYVAAVNADPNVAPQDFWKRIPGDIFVVMASDIATLNVRYVPSKLTSETDPNVIKTLQALMREARKLETLIPEANDSGVK